MGNVVKRNICHFQLNIAVITQIREEKQDSPFFFFSPQSRLFTFAIFSKAGFNAIDSVTFYIEDITWW